MDIVGLGTGLVFFLCTLTAYITGVNHGKQISNKEVPQINLNPEKAYKEHKTAKEEKVISDLYQQGWDNIMSYDGTEQPKVVSE